MTIRLKFDDSEMTRPACVPRAPVTLRDMRMARNLRSQTRGSAPPFGLKRQHFLRTKKITHSRQKMQIASRSGFAFVTRPKRHRMGQASSCALKPKARKPKLPLFGKGLAGALDAGTPMLSGRTVWTRLRPVWMVKACPDPAPVAQLDRALPSEGRGHRFDSCRVHQICF